jgi:hypothetical protein
VVREQLIEFMQSEVDSCYLERTLIRCRYRKMSLNGMHMCTNAATKPQTKSMVTNSRRGKKRRLSPRTDGDNAAKRRKVTLTAPEKRVKDNKSATGEERFASASTNILDLPFEVLSKILHCSGNYEQIARLGALSRRFDAVCREVLLSAFFKLEVRRIYIKR